ncbi:MAG: 4Fe-4S binding protein [Planctomycetes bacterium]|nr:4Fe-4S binding protein [Planctomycetota bacterium]
MGKRRACVLVLVHLAVLAHVAHWKLGGTTLTPVEPSEAMQTLELGWINAGFVLFALAIVLTLVVGRFFCGWVCHLVAYQDLCAWLLARVGLKPRPVRSRLLVWVPLGAAVYMFAWPSIARALAGEASPSWIARFTTDDLWATFPGPGIAVLTLVVDGFLIVWLLGAKGFCTYGCPYGAVFGAVERVAPGRIRVTDACSGCGQCTAHCTSNVRVHEEVARHRQVVDPGCMKCLDCVSVCPEDALYFGFGAKNEKKPSSAKPKRVYDFTWGEELFGAAVFALTLASMRGLYELVPFLLAIGVSVIAAAVPVAAWRALRSREFAFQTLALRRGGRVTGAGVGAASCALAGFAFVGHSGFVQWHELAGERVLVAAGEMRGPERTERIVEAREHLELAARIGLTTSPSLELQLASILREQNDLDGAWRHFERAHELSPKRTSPLLGLASLAIARRELDRAEPLLVEVLALDPNDATAQAWLERVRAELGR